MRPVELGMRKHVLLYGLLGGVLIAGLKLIEYRWLVVEHSVEIYGALVAAVFAAFGRQILDYLQVSVPALQVKVSFQKRMAR